MIVTDESAGRSCTQRPRSKDDDQVGGNLLVGHDQDQRERESEKQQTRAE